VDEHTNVEELVKVENSKIEDLKVKAPKIENHKVVEAAIV
jgi:hypothetical protein